MAFTAPDSDILGETFSGGGFIAPEGDLPPKGFVAPESDVMPEPAAAVMSGDVGRTFLNALLSSASPRAATDNGGQGVHLPSITSGGFEGPLPMPNAASSEDFLNAPKATDFLDGKIDAKGPNFSRGLTDDELQRALSLVPATIRDKALQEIGPTPSLDSLQAERARQIALDQPMAAVDGHGNVIQEPPLNNPEANQAELAKLWQTPVDVTRAALTDAVTTALLPVTYPLYGVQGVAAMQASLPMALSNAFRDTETNPNPEPLPMDVENAEMSQQHPVLATAAKVGQSAAGALPLAVTGGAPAWAQKLLALGFSAQMIANAGPEARTLGTELGKNPEDRDNDAITSAVSDLVQDFGFAPFVGLHGTRDIVERYADKPMYVIRKLSDQLQNAPILPSLTTPNLVENLVPAAGASERSAPEPVEKPISQKIDDLAAAIGDIKAALTANQILPKPSEPTPIAAADETFTERTPQPAQENTISSAAAPSNVPFGFRTHAEGLAQKLEGLKAELSGNPTYSTFFPGLEPTTAKLIWNTAVSVAQNLIRAGGTVADAIDAAISHIRENFTGTFDERSARAALSRSLGLPDSARPGPKGVAKVVSAPGQTQPAQAAPLPEWGKYDLGKVPAGSDPIAFQQSFPKSEMPVTSQELPKTSDGLQLWAMNQLEKLPNVVRSLWGNEVVLYKGNDLAARASDYISGGAGFGPSRDQAATLPMLANTIRNAMAYATVRGRPWSAYLYRYAGGQLHVVIVDNEKGTVERQFVAKQDLRDPNFQRGSDLRVLYRNGIEASGQRLLTRQQPLPVSSQKGSKTKAKQNEDVEQRPKKSKIVGGAYKDLEADGGVRHHMPAKSVSTLSEDDGPAIWMEADDHAKTASHGSGADAAAYRDRQAALIDQGRFDEALQMDIDDMRSKFGKKYDEGIKQMLEYYKTIPRWKLKLH